MNLSRLIETIPSDFLTMIVLDEEAKTLALRDAYLTEPLVASTLSMHSISVKFMRDARDELSKRYLKDPEAQEKELVRIREKCSKLKQVTNKRLKDIHASWPQPKLETPDVGRYDAVVQSQTLASDEAV